MTDSSERRRRHLIAAIGLAIGALGCGGGGAADGSSITGPRAEPEAPAPPSAPSSNVVTTGATTFSPTSITIAQGASVTWRIEGSTHNVTFIANKPTGGDAPNTAPGSTFARTFTIPGPYPYECTLHSGMVGTVVVQGATASVFTSVAVTPTTPSVTVGATTPLAASARDQDGNALAGVAAATWTSSNAAVVTVDGSGVVTGVAAGTATITAAMVSGGLTKTGTATLTVTAAPSVGSATVMTPNETFTPPLVTIAAGSAVTWQFSGALHNVTFGALKPAGGDIPNTAAGIAVARTFATAGTYDYQCTRHVGMTGQVVVTGGATPPPPPPTVVPVFTSVSITPATPNVTIGATTPLAASARDQDGNALAGVAAATWTSSTTAVATVDASGVVTGVAAGTATITASMVSGGLTKTGTATLTVTAAPSVGSATVTTPNETFTPPLVTIAAGSTVTWQFSGALHNVTFGTLKPAGGDIPNTAAGIAVARTFATAGTYNYECTRHVGMTGQVVVTGGATPPPVTPPPTVVPVFTSVAVTPTTPSVTVGATTPLAASARDQDGNVLAGVAAATWTSSTTAVATVDASGVVTGVAAGSATITAAMVSGGLTKTGTATLTVTAAPSVGSATVTTPNETFTPPLVTIAAGSTVTWQFSGALHNVTFGALKPAGGDIPNTAAGIAVARTFATAGTYDYQCTRHVGMTGQVVVTGGATPPPVTPPPTVVPVFTSVAVTPTTPSVTVGATTPLAASARDQDGNVLAGVAAATWTSSTTAVATVDGSGVVTGVAAGSATITAAMVSGGLTKTGTATLTVTAAPSVGSATVTTPNETFTPPLVTIAAGSTVTWQFSGALHNVTFGALKPAGGDIPNTAAGIAVARTFATAGTYDYQCTRHGGMTGQVVVTGGATLPTPTPTPPPTSDIVVLATPNAFTPERLEIAAGGTVTWEFSGGSFGIVFDGAAPPGGNIPVSSPGSRVSRTFPTAGDYDYQSSNNRDVQGRIRVR